MRLSSAEIYHLTKYRKTATITCKNVLYSSNTGTWYMRKTYAK